MGWQLRDPRFRQAVRTVAERLSGRGALTGTVGVQIHLGAAIGLDKRGPPAHAIEVVAFGQASVPQCVDAVPVQLVDSLGFEMSVKTGSCIVDLDGDRFPVAAPEHILGMLLATPDLPPDAKWATFVLMRTFAGRLDLEEARGFLKRCPSVERQSMLAELAYLAS